MPEWAAAIPLVIAVLVCGWLTDER